MATTTKKLAAKKITLHVSMPSTLEMDFVTLRDLALRFMGFRESSPHFWKLKTKAASKTYINRLNENRKFWCNDDDETGILNELRERDLIACMTPDFVEQFWGIFFSAKKGPASLHAFAGDLYFLLEDFTIDEIDTLGFNADVRDRLIALMNEVLRPKVTPLMEALRAKEKAEQERAEKQQQQRAEIVRKEREQRAEREADAMIASLRAMGYTITKPQPKETPATPMKAAAKAFNKPKLVKKTVAKSALVSSK